MLALMLFLAIQDDVVKESDHELAAEAAVTIKTVVGRVRVEGTDAKSAHVKTVKRGRDQEQVEIRVEGRKDRLSIEAIFPKRRHDLDIEIEIDVQVPRSAKSLDVDLVSGAIEVKEAKGHATLKTVSGTIRVDGLTGNLAATSISGDVKFSKVAADRASINLTSGSVEGSAEVGELEVTSVSGRASLDITPRGAAWSVRSSNISGDLSLRFVESAGAKVDLSSLSGRLECDFDLNNVRLSGREDVGRSLRATFGSGAGTVRASSISGNVRLGRIK